MYRLVGSQFMVNLLWDCGCLHRQEFLCHLGDTGCIAQVYEMGSLQYGKARLHTVILLFDFYVREGMVQGAKVGNECGRNEGQRVGGEEWQFERPGERWGCLLPRIRGSC